MLYAVARFTGNYLTKMIRHKERFPVPRDSKAFRALTSGNRTVSPIAAHANWTGNLKEKLAMLYKLGLWLLHGRTGGASGAGSQWQCYMGPLPSATLPHPMISLE